MLLFNGLVCDEANEAASGAGFRGEYYLTCSEWLKLLGELQPETFCCGVT